MCVDVTSEFLVNFSLLVRGAFTTESVMGEKENSMLFTCLHKESLAGDKNRFQILWLHHCVHETFSLTHLYTSKKQIQTAGTLTVTVHQYSPFKYILSSAIQTSFLQGTSTSSSIILVYYALLAEQICL